MAELIPGFKFLGTLDDLTAYKTKQSDKVILKRKWGPSREMIYTKPNYAITRKNIKDFGGASTAASAVKRAMGVMPKVPDYYFFGNLTSLMKIVEARDTANPLGKRHVQLSKYPQLLEGLQISRRNVFESMVHNPIACNLSRTDCSAELTLPALLPGVNFFGIGDFPYYYWRIDLGIVPDMFYNEIGKHAPNNDYPFNFKKTIISDWFHVNQPADAATLQIAMDRLPPDNDYSLMLTVAIHFGKMEQSGEIMFVHYAAGGRVMKVV